MNIPTLQELKDSILADFRSVLNIRFIVGKVVLNAFSAVQAAKLKLIYLTASFVYKNLFPDTADPESQGGTLERQGSLRGITRQAATAGVYTVDVTGSIAATIPPGTTFVSTDNSTNPDFIYILDTLFTFTGTTGQISVRALDLGSDARLEIGDELQVSAPIANVDSFGYIYSVDTAPTEAETDSDFRDRIIDSYRIEPQGGARVDYRVWSSVVSGVKEVYPYVKTDYPGEINLYVEANAADSLDGNGTPTAAILTAVENAIEPSKIPMGVFEIYYLPINPIPVDVEISDLSDVTTLTAIEAAIKDFLLDVRPFIDGADSVTDINKDKLYLSDIFTIVRNIIDSSVTFTDIVLKVDSVSVNLYQFTNNDIPYINSVTNV